MEDRGREVFLRQFQRSIYMKPLIKGKTVRFQLFLIGLAVGISFIYSAFHLFYLHDRGWNYTNAIVVSTFTQTRDNDFYMTQLKDIYEANYKLINPYFVEYKHDDAAARQEFPVYFIAFIGKMLHLKVQSLVILMDLLFPLLIFATAYSFFNNILFSPRISALGAFTLVMTPQLLFLPQLWHYLQNPSLRLYGLIPSLLLTAHGSFGTFGRMLNPQFTYLLLILSLFFFFKGLKIRNVKYYLMCAILGTILSYSYVYLSTYLYCVIGSCTLIACYLRKKWYIRDSIFTLMGIIVASLPFWYEILTSPHNELQRMSWVELQRTPILSIDVLSVLVMIGFTCFLWKSTVITDFTMMVCVAILAAGFICVNQQVITGRSVQPWHYQLYVIPESLLIASVILVSNFFQWHVRRHGRISRVLTVSLPLNHILFIISILIGILGTIFHPAVLTFLFSFHAEADPPRLLENIYHYSLLFSIMLFLIGLSLTKWNSRHFSQRVKIGTLCMILWIGYVMGDIFLARYAYYIHILCPNFGDLQQLAPALNWLDQETPPESVVLSMIGKEPFVHQSEAVSTANLITIYTHNNVYMSEEAHLYAVPTVNELKDRVYNMMYLMGIQTPESFHQFMYRLYTSGSFEEYQQKFKYDVYQELKKYRVDYVWYGPRERQYFQINPDSYAFLHKVYDDQIVQIYQVL